MAKPFLAMITPVSSGAHPDHELPTPPAKPGQPPHIDHTLPGDLPHPSHPIYYPLPPGAPVDPSYGVPEKPVIDNTLPGSQPGIDNTLPGSQPGIDNTLPIVPPNQGGWGPIYIWGGGPGARPPIALPPEGEEPAGKVEWKAVWSPSNGWQTVGVVLPEAPVPTPSKKK
jgi:hypothetical protein